MKLLFDENLSARLPAALEDCYPGSLHVREVGLKSAPDSAVWEYAAAHGFSIVTKDADLRQRSFLYGHPPNRVRGGRTEGIPGSVVRSTRRPMSVRA